MTRAQPRDRRLLALAGMVSAAVLLGAAFLLTIVSFSKMRQVVAEEFNAQQLVLARNLATLMRQEVEFLRRELLVLSQSPLRDESGGRSNDWESGARVVFSTNRDRRGGAGRVR